MGNRALRVSAVACALIGGLAACSGTHSSVPTGPSATVSGPVSGGKGVFLLEARPADLAASRYVQTEYFASGTATSYTPAGPLSDDGRWTVRPATTATYKTRVVVRAPEDPAKFNGTVLVEWLNVTAGADTPTDFSYMGPEIRRDGFAWVGVSAQQVGVSGGGSAVGVAGVPAGGLVGTDPARYGSLHHPGDAYAFDIFSQVGRSLPGLLRGLHVRRLIAIGESQSAFALTTYINAVQPEARVYAGFLVHSRGAGALPLISGNIAAGITGAVHIRPDIGVPVLLAETETDETLLGYFTARQPDSKDIRLWDIAGGSHADAFVAGVGVSVLGCNSVNDAPTHYVLNAALHALDAWVRSGTPPRLAPRMDVRVVGGSPVVQRDALGVAIGGVRTGAVDVPVAAYSGAPVTGASVLCLLFGSTHPFDAATLHRLYPTKAAYLDAFTRATDRAIAAGYLLPADRPAVLAEAAQVNL